MSRQRWVYRQNEKGEVEAVEVTAEREPVARLEFSLDRHYENLKATDGADIGSRRKHREYMHANGLAMADDFKGQWAKAEQQRSAHYTGNAGQAARREAIERAIHTLQKGRR